MTDRDHFAAAALTGLLYPEVDDEFAMPYIVGRAYLWADAMLRERCRGGGDCPGSDNAPNLDAAPAVKAGTPGTGDTQSFDAYAMFAGSVMNWISEATSAADWSSDGGRKIMADACMRCWDAFDRIAYATVHGASPAARASVDSVARQPTARGESDRTDKAAPRPSEGTGDTPKPISGCVSDRPKPINGPDPDSRVWETPVHTPAPRATHGEGSEPREGSVPVAWGVADGKGLLATSIHRIDAVDMQSDYACDTEVVPLYRQAPDFAPPPPDNAAKAPDNAEPEAWAVCTPGDGDWSPCFFHEPHAQRCANAIVGEKNVVPLYRHPPCQVLSPKNWTLTDAEREAVRTAADAYAVRGSADGRESVNAATLRGLLERLGGGE